MYENDKKHGFGTLLLADGSIYVGEFKNGIIEGKGTYEWVGERKY
jgi:hypothetical protein